MATWYGQSKNSTELVAAIVRRCGGTVVLDKKLLEVVSTGGVYITDLGDRLKIEVKEV